MPFLFQVVQVCVLAQFAVAQLGGSLISLGGDCLVLLLAYLFQHLHRVFHRRRGDAASQPHAGAGLVNQVYGLVRKEPVGDKPRGQYGGRPYSLFSEVHLMMVFVTPYNALEDLNGLVAGGLFDTDGL